VPRERRGRLQIHSAEALDAWRPWRAYVNMYRRGDHPRRHKDTPDYHNGGFPSLTVPRTRPSRVPPVLRQ
jgi:hypothetical protein